LFPVIFVAAVVGWWVFQLSQDLSLGQML